MVLASVFHVDPGESDEQLRRKLSERMRNNTKWFGVKYDESVLDEILQSVRSHTDDFVVDGEFFKVFVKYRPVVEDSLSQQETKKQNNRR